MTRPCPSALARPAASRRRSRPCPAPRRPQRPGPPLPARSRPGCCSCPCALLLVSYGPRAPGAVRCPPDARRADRRYGSRPREANGRTRRETRPEGRRRHPGTTVGELMSTLRIGAREPGVRLASDRRVSSSSARYCACRPPPTGGPVVPFVLIKAILGPAACGRCSARRSRAWSAFRAPVR